MANFLLRGFDDKLWHRVKMRAVADKISLRALAIRLFEMYADGLRIPKDKAAAK